MLIGQISKATTEHKNKTVEPNIEDFTADVEDDVVTFDANILPIGYDSVVSLSAAVQ